MAKSLKLSTEVWIFIFVFLSVSLMYIYLNSPFEKNTVSWEDNIEYEDATNIIIRYGIYDKTKSTFVIEALNNAGEDIEIKKILFTNTLNNNADLESMPFKAITYTLKKDEEKIFEVNLNDIGLNKLSDEVWVVAKKDSKYIIGKITKENIIVQK
tara:strand:- start:105 stop:569 length:465 start_codon:yes stop_codon:yes gene_type:complete